MRSTPELLLARKPESIFSAGMGQVCSLGHCENSFRGVRDRTIVFTERAMRRICQACGRILEMARASPSRVVLRLAVQAAALKVELLQ